MDKNKIANKIAKELTAGKSVKIGNIKVSVSYLDSSNFTTKLQLIPSTSKDLDKIDEIGIDDFKKQIKKRLNVKDIEFDREDGPAGIVVKIDNDDILDLIFK